MKQSVVSGSQLERRQVHAGAQRRGCFTTQDSLTKEDNLVLFRSPKEVLFTLTVRGQCGSFGSPDRKRSFSSHSPKRKSRLTDISQFLGGRSGSSRSLNQQTCFYTQLHLWNDITGGRWRQPFTFTDLWVFGLQGDNEATISFQKCNHCYVGKKNPLSEMLLNSWAWSLELPCHISFPPICRAWMRSSITRAVRKKLTRGPTSS